MGWNYSSIPKLQRLYRWSLGMDKWFYTTLYNGCGNLSMLGLKLFHVTKRGNWWQTIKKKIFQKRTWHKAGGISLHVKRCYVIHNTMSLFKQYMHNKRLAKEIVHISNKGDITLLLTDGCCQNNLTSIIYFITSFIWSSLVLVLNIKRETLEYFSEKIFVAFAYDEALQIKALSLKC